MRQIPRLSVITVSIALLMTLSSCSDTQNTPEADDQPSTPTEKRELIHFTVNVSTFIREVLTNEKEV